MHPSRLLLTIFIAPLLIVLGMLRLTCGAAVGAESAAAHLQNARPSAAANANALMRHLQHLTLK